MLIRATEHQLWTNQISSGTVLFPLSRSFIYFTFFIVAYCIYFLQQNLFYFMMASQ